MHEIAETKKLAGIPIAVPFFYGLVHCSGISRFKISDFG
jgi:hypothetical protein